jgi:hypothetical protein
VEHGQPILPLVGEQGDDELRTPVGGGTEHGAGAAVGDHGRDSREQPGLRHEALDPHVGWHRPDRRGIDVGPDRGVHIDR